jgi:hypothetical protein
MMFLKTDETVAFSSVGGVNLLSVSKNAVKRQGGR